MTQSQCQYQFKVGRFRGAIDGTFVRLLLAFAGAIVIDAATPEAKPEGRPSDASLARMFAVPGLSANPNMVDWRGLQKLEGKRCLVFRGIENEAAFAHHPFLVYWDGCFFAQWNDGYAGEDHAGQRVRYSMSADATSWRPAIDLTGRENNRRFTACGFWIREGELFALAALRDATGGPDTGLEPVLFAYHWDKALRRFADRRVILRNFFAGNVPARVLDGDWLMIGKGGVGSWGPMKAAKGGVQAIDDWSVRDLPGAGTIEEGEWYALPNGHLVAHFRTRGIRPFFLARCYSRDNGVTWSDPITTNFPEQGSRHHALRLSNGLYAILVNPSPMERIPFAIALSRDGLVYDRIANVRNEETAARWAGRAKSKGYQYMRGYEHEGKLYTIYSVNKEDIEVTVVSLSALEEMYR